ncbi:MAG: OmpA family protein [Cyclobacteriaceae bacterium]
MKALPIALLIIIFALPVFAQNKLASIPYNKGKSLYDEDDYEGAIPKFKLALKADKNCEDCIYYLGLSYRYNGDNAEAIEQFEALEGINPDYWGWFYYEAGRANNNLGQFAEAVPWFEKFMANYPNTPNKQLFHHQAKYLKEYALGRIELEKQPMTMSEPTLFSNGINSAWDDYMPATNPTGRILYFTSTRKGGFAPDDDTDDEGDEDLYKITMGSDGTWSSPELLPAPLNSSSNEGAPAFSADGQTMVFTACGRDEGIGSCDIYTATLDGSTWTPQNLGDVVNSDDWDSQPSISADGSRIFFTSERDGGYGSSDIYYIERNPMGDWGVPVNLGAMINTPFNDNSPFISPDGKTLYFSSSGHPGFGGSDLFRSVFENGRWSKPVNMGKPLNTEANDRYFTIGGSGEVAYFASAKSGVLNLYQIDVPEELRPTPTVVVSGVVTDAKNDKKLGAWVLVEDIESGELIATGKSNSVTGEYAVVLPAGRNYSVSANREAYFFYSQNFDVPATARYQEITKDIPLRPIEKGAKVVLNNIFFDTGKSTLRSESRVELNKAVDLMKTNPSMVIEVGGHTDNVGNDDSNMKLSHARAKSVMDYLTQGGIAASRLQAKGYGENNPIATNDTDEGRQANRRTEFVILEF